MRYVHEFVDDLVCERCPHYVEDEEGEFDLICLAQEDGSEFLFPDECPAYLGEWGAWRSFADHLSRVALLYWCASANGWSWDAYQIGKLMRCAVPQLADAVGWSG